MNEANVTTPGLNTTLKAFLIATLALAACVAGIAQSKAKKPSDDGFEALVKRLVAAI